MELLSTSPILLFVNPVSGGGFGQSLIDAVQEIENIHVVKLPEDQEKWETLGDEILRHNDLKAIVCGGDGSVNWVVSLLTHFYGNEKTDGNFRPPLAIIPLGTGNDMSNMLGWGTSFGSSDLSKIHDFIKRIENATDYKNLDVWQVSHKRTDQGHENDEETKKTMLNYFSIGVDANIANDFAHCRTNCSGCFCCHCMSKCLYVPVTFGSLRGQDCLKDYMTAKYVDEEENAQNIEFAGSAKTFVCQAITKIYGGSDLWRSNTPRAVDDGKFEIITQGGVWSLAVDQIGIHLGKEITQTGHVEIMTSQPCAFQIDGEPYIVNGPCKFIVNRTGSYPMLFSSI